MAEKQQAGQSHLTPEQMNQMFAQQMENYTQKVGEQMQQLTQTLAQRVSNLEAEREPRVGGRPAAAPGGLSLEQKARLAERYAFRFSQVLQIVQLVNQKAMAGEQVDQDQLLEIAFQVMGFRE